MKKICLLVFIMCGFTAAAQAQSTLDLKSYFPAPYGAYDRLKLSPRDNSGNDYDINADCSSQGGLGTIVVVNEDPEIRICAEDSVGNPVWSALPGVWSQTNDYIYPTDTDPDIQVGIGTDTPDTKLHVRSSDDALVTIEGGSGDAVGVEFWEDTGSAHEERASLRFNSSSDFVLMKNEASGHVKLETGAGNLTLNSDGNVGINDETPDAALEVVGGAGNYLAVSSSSADADSGDLLDITNAGRMYINMPRSGAGRSDESQLQILGNDSGGDPSRISFATTDNDIEYDGGIDNIARFVHTGTSAGSLQFQHNGTPLTRVTNSGMLHVSKKFSIGRINGPDGDDITHTETGDIVHDAVEFHIHEKNNRSPGTTSNPEDDVIMLLSDNGTVTGIDDNDFQFIEPDTIGVLMPSENLWESDRNSDDGGLMIVGISNGGPDDDHPVSGLNLLGLVGNNNPDTIPAIEIDGNKISGNNLVRMDGDDIVLGINYTSNTTGNEDGTVFLANGSVGVGFDRGEKPDTDVNLHVRSSMKLQPRSIKPWDCGSGYGAGAMYYNSTCHALCICNNSSWVEVEGTGVDCCND